MFSERELRFFRNYSENNCLFECETNLTIKRCGCTAYYMPYVKPLPICGFAKMNCVEESSLLALNENCNCLPGCNELRYDVTYFELKDNPVSIVSRPNRFQIIKKIRYEWINLIEIIANIGGTFGVFVGFSMLAIFEIFYFCFVLPCKKEINTNRLRRMTHPFMNIQDGKMDKKRFKRIIKNEIDEVYGKTEIFLLKYLLKLSLPRIDRILWFLVTFFFILLSVYFTYSIWDRSYSDPLIVSLSNTHIPVAMVSNE